MERDEGAGAEPPRGRDKILCYINMQSPGNGTNRNLTQSCWGGGGDRWFWLRGHLVRSSQQTSCSTFTVLSMFPRLKWTLTPARVLEGCFDLHQASCWVSSGNVWHERPESGWIEMARRRESENIFSVVILQISCTEGLKWV